MTWQCVWDMDFFGEIYRETAEPSSEIPRNAVRAISEAIEHLVSVENLDAV